MIIDPVYEGKSMAGLIDPVTTGQIGKDSTVRYAHLGGDGWITRVTHDATFDQRQQAWREWTASPWGRVRFAVVGHALDRELAELGPGPHRILDVGGGDGGDALTLAAAGHDVTLLDPSEPMLAAAAASAAAHGVPLTTVMGGLESLSSVAGLAGYDLVTCHFVLHYRDDDAADLARLAAVVRPGGLLSVALPNPVGQTLAALVRRGPAAAHEELNRDTIATVTFDRDVRKVPAELVEDLLSGAGLRVVGRYGGRIANDLLTDDDAKRDPEHFARLLELELALCDRDPYRRIGAFWQLVATRG